MNMCVDCVSEIIERLIQLEDLVTTTKPVMPHASLVHFTQQSELGVQVHCVGGQRGGTILPLLVFLSFLIPALFLSFLQVQP